MSLDQIRNWVDAQPAEFALLEYLTLPDRVVAFVVRQGRREPAFVTIPLGLPALSRCANAVFPEMDGSSACASAGRPGTDRRPADVAGPPGA